MPMSPPLTCLRVVINETVPAVPVIKAAGMEQAHYRVYLKEWLLFIHILKSIIK